MPHQNLRVLVVDDDVVVGQMFLEVLEMLGHRAVLARSGAEAVECLERQGFDLVISDLRMPRMNGRELWDRLKLTHPRLAEGMVFISAEQADAASCQFLRMSGHAYLQKPFDIRELRSILQRAAGSLTEA